LISRKSSSLKPLGQMNRNLVGSILGRSSIKIAKISIHLAKRLQRRRFFINQLIRNKNWLWRPCLVTDRDEMSNLYRGPSKRASYQVSIHLTKRCLWNSIYGRFSIKIAHFVPIC
jgi:hypothetical protein